MLVGALDVMTPCRWPPRPSSAGGKLGRQIARVLVGGIWLPTGLNTGRPVGALLCRGYAEPTKAVAVWVLVVVVLAEAWSEQSGRGDVVVVLSGQGPLSSFSLSSDE